MGEGGGNALNRGEGNWWVGKRGWTALGNPNILRGKPSWKQLRHKSETAAVGKKRKTQKGINRKTRKNVWGLPTVRSRVLRGNRRTRQKHEIHIRRSAKMQQRWARKFVEKNRLREASANAQKPGRSRKEGG